MAPRELLRAELAGRGDVNWDAMLAVAEGVASLDKVGVNTESTELLKNPDGLTALLAEDTIGDRDTYIEDDAVAGDRDPDPEAAERDLVNVEELVESATGADDLWLTDAAERIETLRGRDDAAVLLAEDSVELAAVEDVVKALFDDKGEGESLAEALETVTAVGVLCRLLTSDRAEPVADATVTAGVEVDGAVNEALGLEAEADEVIPVATREVLKSLLAMEEEDTALDDIGANEVRAGKDEVPADGVAVDEL